MKTEIIPYVGFQQIKLGQTLGQIELLLGKSSEDSKEKFSDNSLDMILEYHHLGVDLTFSSDDDFLLGSMTFYSKDFSLKGESLIGLPEEAFLKKATTIFSDLEIDSDFNDLNSKDYTSNLNGLSFWIENGIVESISIFPDYKEDNETPIWPSK